MSRGQASIALPQVVDYIIDCYQGTEGTGRKAKRQFMWERANGDVVIGNTRAFTDHLAEKFKIEANRYTYGQVHKLLSRLGERIKPKETRHKTGEQTGRGPQEPEVRVVGRKHRHGGDGCEDLS